MLWKSLPDAFKKLDPRVQVKNPVMFVVEVGALVTMYTAITKPSIFNWTIVVFLWLTVVFANMAEAVAEGRGKAQAETLRRTKRETVARRLIGWSPGQAGTREEEVPGTQLTLGDHVVVEAGEIIPATVTWWRASPRWTSRRSPASPRRSSGSPAATGPRSPADQGAVRPDRGEDHVQAGRDLHRPDDRPGRGRGAAEDAERDRAEHPARRADDHLHAGGHHAAADGLYSARHSRWSILVALLVALIPTTIGALLSAIGIAGMDRLVQRNVLAMSGRAVEAAGDVNTLLLDKTGTITIGNRQATEFLLVNGVIRGGRRSASHADRELGAVPVWTHPRRM